MAHVRHACMKYDDRILTKGSLFKPTCSNRFILDKMERFLPPDMKEFEGCDCDNPE